MARTEAVYTPDRDLGMGPRMWATMARDLFEARELIWRFFVRDFSARYRQSMLGYVWAFFPPIIATAAFWALTRSSILPVGPTPLPYVIYVFLGLMVWQLFSGGLVATTQSLVTAGGFVTKINFSRETLIISAFGQAIVELLLRAVLLAGLMAWFMVRPAWTIVLLPLVLLPLCFMTVGLGFLLAPVNGFTRDVANALMVIMTFGMFFSPVIYPPPTAWPQSIVNYLNPVSPFVIAARDLAIGGGLSQPFAYTVTSVVSVIVFAAGWRSFRIVMPRVLERL
jgi:lipopolysaccharide transport system permease protein